MTLVASAHTLGMYVILDEVLNHTAWDNALLTQHPEYYLHNDGNRTNPASIVEAGNGAFPDSAQLDYKTMPDLGLRKYVTDMVVSDDPRPTTWTASGSTPPTIRSARGG